MVELSNLKLKLRQLKQSLSARSYGDVLLTHMLLDLDREICRNLRRLGLERDYKAVTAKHSPTKHGFKRDLEDAIQERLGFLNIFADERNTDDVGHGSRTQITVGTGNVYLKGDDMRDNKSVHIQSGGNTNTGNFAVAETITNSFNERVSQSGADGDLKKHLTGLNNAVAEMSKQLNEEQAKRVQRDLEALNNEVLSEDPRKKWYQLSAEGIKEAAKTVGEIAVPVTMALKAVEGLLGY